MYMFSYRTTTGALRYSASSSSSSTAGGLCLAAIVADIRSRCPFISMCVCVYVSVCVCVCVCACVRAWWQTCGRGVPF